MYCELFIVVVCYIVTLCEMRTLCETQTSKTDDEAVNPCHFVLISKLLAVTSVVNEYMVGNSLQTSHGCVVRYIEVVRYTRGDKLLCLM